MPKVVLIIKGSELLVLEEAFDKSTKNFTHGHIPISQKGNMRFFLCTKKDQAIKELPTIPPSFPSFSRFFLLAKIVHKEVRDSCNGTPHEVLVKE